MSKATINKREKIEDALIPILQNIKIHRNKVDAIKKRLLENDVFEGETSNLIINPENVKNVDIRLLCLLTKAIQDELGYQTINVDDYFTKSEIKDSLQYTSLLDYASNGSQLPLERSEVISYDSSTFMTKMSVQTINELLQGGDLYYNFDTQRESKYVERKNKVIRVPKVNKKAVREIAQHLLNGTLIKTTLVFNAAPNTSDEGEELIYNSRKNVLMITEGTRLDILDGYHRTLAIQQALLTKPDLDFDFPVLITNYSTKKAQMYIGQIALATPISLTKAKAMRSERRSDEAVQTLIEQSSELKGRISDSEFVHSSNNQIVSYNVLTDTIEQEFEMTKKIDAIKVGEYLSKFFDYLFGIYSDEFIDNVKEVSKISIINSNNMFVGYVALASRLYKHKANLSVSDIQNVISKIDFSKDNPMWKELNILDDKGNFVKTNVARKNIEKFFKEIEI